MEARLGVPPRGSRLPFVTMSTKWRMLALVTLAAAALGLGWTSSQSWTPGETGSDHPSLSLQDGRGAPEAAVVERSASVLRTLTGDRPSRSQLPWALPATLALAGLAGALLWTRSGRADRWSCRQLRLLRRTVALRAPPSSRLV
jgi:hypothetical protein